MREIRDKLSELATAYEGQLKLYRQIEEVGSGEREFIRRGELERLLDVLKKKESLLTQAGELELHIRLLQDQLSDHFALDYFSLPQLKLVAPNYYQDELETLEATVAELLPVLEALEIQERRNEASLNKYLEASQEPKTSKAQIRLAGRAYGRG